MELGTSVVRRIAVPTRKVKLLFIALAVKGESLTLRMLSQS
jgi:hypothetical protein